MKQIEIGQRVHCILHGGRNGTVVAIHGEQSPDSTREIMGGFGVAGGTAHFDIIWDDDTRSPMIPEALLRRSVQWRVLDEPPATPSEIKARVMGHEQHTAEAKAAEAVARAVFEAKKTELSSQYPNLRRSGEGASGGKLVAINLRILLKEAFPGVKFSVRSDYSHVGISWVDGPTEKRVQEVVDRFSAGRFDGMEDIYKYEATAWGELFGSVEYDSVSRSISTEVFERCIDALYEHFAPDMAHIPRKDAMEMRADRFSQFPNVDVTVSDAINALAGAWDAIEQKFDPEAARYRNRWLVEHITEREALKQGGPAPC